jgi:group I intron endonuclease
VNSGIYKLTFSSGDFYVGRSINIQSRFKDHLSTLKAGKHRNHKVQDIYNKYGQPELFILEECSSECHKDREVHWIKELNATKVGLNVSNGGDDSFYGEDHPYSKYSNIQVLAVVKLLGSTEPLMSHKEVSEATGVGEATIKDIVCERAHLWVKEQYPNEFQIMLDTKSLRKLNSLRNLDPFANKKTKVYPALTSPLGEVFYVEHLTNFAKEHGLQASNLSKVFSGERVHHKGWKLAIER